MLEEAHSEKLSAFLPVPAWDAVPAVSPCNYSVTVVLLLTLTLMKAMGKMRSKLS